MLNSEMNKKNVCFFLREFPVLSETFVAQQINSLIEIGHKVSIVSMYEGNTLLWENELFNKHDLETKCIFLLDSNVRKRSKFARIKSIIYCYLRLALVIKNIPFLVFNIPKYLAAGGLIATDEVLSIAKSGRVDTGSDVIIAHFGQVGVAAAFLAKLNVFKGDIFTVFHGFEISKYVMVKKWKKLYVWLSNNSALLLPISELWAQKLEKLGVNKGKIQVHHMGIDLSKFRFADVPLSKPLRLVTVARATEKKGLAYSLEAIERCKTDVEYHIIGGGELLESLKVQVSNYKKRSSIFFHGPQSSDFVADKLRESDVFILTSIEDSQGDMEGIPVSLMEAMATGVLVLSTVHSGIPELITNSVSGYLVAERNSEEIALAIDKISDLKDVSDIRKNALLKVQEEFNQEKLSEILSDLIKHQ